MRKSVRLDFKFSQKHVDYIRRCRAATINVAEGAVRAGKTIDNVFAFADELERSPDTYHLASGSTSANAKLNIGIANGYGLEAMFRGRCRWTKYQGNEALRIRTPTGIKYVIFAGGGKADSFKKIRGNSYGLWIATEINLHHEDFIREAFNRQLAAGRRKVYWDLNPEHPKAPIYVKYLDVYEAKTKAGEFPHAGYYNYEHFTIFDNQTVTQERLKEILIEYVEGSIWYMRDILGKRCIAEGLIYSHFATQAAQPEEPLRIDRADVREIVRRGQYEAIHVGVDFGGNGSGHAFVATLIREDYEGLILLKSERIEGILTPSILADNVLEFCRQVQKDYACEIDTVFCDSAETVLIAGVKEAIFEDDTLDCAVRNARKEEINTRIFTFVSVDGRGGVRYTEDCASLIDALSTAVWNPKFIGFQRLDNGTSDIDSLDAMEYTFERYWKELRRTDD